MKRYLAALGALALLAAGALVARADGPVEPPPADATPDLSFEKYRLDNGLEVILHQDNRVPLVAVDVWYHVGSGNERPGRSGFAHLFEHMLFQGSKHVGEDRHFEVLKNLGATSVNGTTNFDRTNYFEVVPSNQLEAALWLESDRMGYVLPLVTQKSLDNQIDVVRNERRQRIDNVPYVPSYLKVGELIFPEGHPYKYSIIGKHEDLEAATLDDVRNFYKTWYVPANATLLIAGDFERDAARQLVQKWFGSFPKSQKPTFTPPAMPAVEKQRAVVDDPFATLPMVMHAWLVPPAFAPGEAELQILADALSRDGTGRLYKRLVHDTQLAQQVNASVQSAQLGSVFMISVMLKPDADRAKVEAILAEELDGIRAEPLAPEEIARTVVAREAGVLWGLESLLARAETLQRYNHYVGTPDFLQADLDRYRQADGDAILRYAREYLDPDRRVEVITRPAGKASPPSGAK